MINFLPGLDFICALEKEGSSLLKNYWKLLNIPRFPIVNVLSTFVIFFAPFYLLNASLQPVQQILTAYHLEDMKNYREVFCFAPGSSTTNLKHVNTQNLDYLAYFDIPVTSEGDLDRYSPGYTNLRSEAAVNLFESVRQNGGKVLLTLTPVNNQALWDFLDNSDYQQKLLEQIIWEVNDIGADGVVIDFEPKGTKAADYQDKFSQFTAGFTQDLHQYIPDSWVAVAVPASATDGQGIYDLAFLSKSADRILIMAADFAVPELRGSRLINPVYGYGEKDYWNNISSVFNTFLKQAPKEKLVIERAWYGNGKDYPLYVPSSKPAPETVKEPEQTTIDEKTTRRLLLQVPVSSRSAAAKVIPLVGKALASEGILDSNVLAYALATIEHETDGTFEPIEEIQGRFSARRLGYEGGTNYFGRGFIQLTHLRNYRIFGERIGMGDALAKQPQLATSWEIAAKILAAFFKDNNVASLASRGQFMAARLPINPDSQGWKVASLAYKYI